jgi:hypothetical protein
MPTRSTAGARLRRIAGPASDALHGNRRSHALIVLAAIAALLCYVPVASLRGDGGAGGTALRLADVPVPVTDVRWTTAVRGGGAVQEAAVADLMTLLLAAAAGAVAVAILAMVSVSAARAWRRAGELVIRRSVGASRRDLLLSALAEALVATLIVAGPGLALAALATRLGAGAWPGAAGGWHLSVSLALGLVTAAIVVGAVAPVGGAATRRRLVDAEERTIPGFVPAIQLGLSLAVLMASVAILRRVPPDAPPAGAGAATATLHELDASALAPGARSAAFASLVARLEAMDGVGSVSLTSRRGHVGLGTIDFVKTDCDQCPVGGLLLPWRELYAAHFFVSGDTFRTQGARIVAGRGFTASDEGAATPVAVVNRFMAARYFANGDAVGRDIFVGSGIRSQRHQVVGVVDDARPSAFGGGGQPLEAVYLSVLQHPVAAADLLVRSSGAHPPGEAALIDALRGFPGIIRTGATTERAMLARESAPLGWFGRAFALEATAIFAIALAGTFTAMALWVRSLRAELALRRAMGATRGRILIHVLARAAGVGLRGAAVGAVFFTPVVLPEIERLVPGAPVWDPATLAIIAGLLAIAAAAGALLPARAALRAPPAAGLASG